MINDLNKIKFESLKFEKKNKENVIIGKGATSTVFCGEYNRKKVAIKKMNSNTIQDDLIHEIIFLKNIEPLC
jgi:predicted Ser/Thr protein kinase